MSLIPAAIEILSNVLDRVIPDKNARAQAKEALQVLDQQGELQLLVGQLEVNRVEAANENPFVSGWRPFIGWICGCALAYNFILVRLLEFVLAVVVMYHPDLTLPALPELDTGELMPLILGMLGLVGARTYERQQGVARK